MDESRKLGLLEELVAGLCRERGLEMPCANDAEGLWGAFRALVNTRQPRETDPVWLAKQDELLGAMISERGIASVDDAVPVGLDGRMRLWQGDITTLAVDAIVNAANSQMLGCWRPGHHCIDNAIHTFAGVQLRLECAHIMDAQGASEPTGAAKITWAYNLPSQRIIHTVGPIVDGPLTQRHRRELASCYRSCLELAHESGLASIAFCCISTGVFGFPQGEAAKIAIETVGGWLDSTQADLTVVFNVFCDKDWQIYSRLLGVQA